MPSASATRPRDAALASSPPTATASATLPSRVCAHSRMSAAIAARPSAPPPSIATETFGDNRAAIARCASARRSAAASAPASKISRVANTGERIGEHRNAVIRRDAERSDVGCELRSGYGTQSADLDAAARRDLDDAVAVPSRRAAQFGECGERDRSDRIKPHQQAVAGRHRRRQAGTSAAAARDHAMTSACSAARPAPISLRCGCQRPRRRAASSRSAIAAAAAGFSRSKKSRTRASAI